MLHLLKKYRFTVAIFLMLALLLMFIIPLQKHSYFSQETEAIERKARLALICTELVIFFIIFITVAVKLKTLKSVFNSFVNTIIIAGGFFFMLDPIFLSATLFLNKLYSTTIAERKYSVVHLDTTQRNLLLWDYSTNTSIDASQLLPPNGTVSINPKDTLTISFTKGMLGFNFGPTLLPKPH
jgi:hypothetical protein